MLPSKKALRNNTEDFVEKRRQELQIYLQMLARHVVLKNDPTLKLFLTCPTPEEFENIRREQDNESSSKSRSSWKFFHFNDTFNYLYASMKSKLFEKNEPNEFKLDDKLDSLSLNIVRDLPFLEKSILLLENQINYKKKYASDQEELINTLKNIRTGDLELDSLFQKIIDYHTEYESLIRVEIFLLMM